MLGRIKGLAILCLVALAATMAQATTIPDAGVEVDGYVTAAITALGSVVAVVVGGYFAFLIVRKGLRWAGRIA